MTTSSKLLIVRLSLDAAMVWVVWPLFMGRHMPWPTWLAIGALMVAQYFAIDTKRDVMRLEETKTKRDLVRLRREAVRGRRTDRAGDETGVGG